VRPLPMRRTAFIVLANLSIGAFSIGLCIPILQKAARQLPVCSLGADIVLQGVRAGTEVRQAEVTVAFAYATYLLEAAAQVRRGAGILDVEIGNSRVEGVEVREEVSSKERVQGVSMAVDSLSAKEGGVARDRGDWTQGLLRQSRLSRLVFKSGDEDEVEDLLPLRSLILLEDIC
jgi:hypothetical protein